MRLTKSRQKTALCIYGLFLAALAFIGISRAFTNNTFADTDTDNIQTVSDSHFVTIHDHGEKLTVKTDAITVAEVLDRANIEILDTDKVEPRLTDFITTDNFHINIYRSRPVVIIDDNIKKHIMTPSYDPKTIAKSAGISLYDGDTVELVKMDTFLETGSATTYKINRNGGETLTVETTIPFTEETIDDDELEAGQEKLVQAGEDGRKTVRYKVKFVEGKEISREVISEEVTVEAVPRIKAVSTKQAAKSVPPEWETCAGWAKQAGVSDGDMYTALTLIYHESGCRVNATNAYSGAYGIPQALPGNKMSSAGSDWETNPVTQIKWMIKYVNGRYGGWSQAMNYWWEHHWY